jgi:hypothetical protein
MDSTNTELIIKFETVGNSVGISYSRPGEESFYEIANQKIVGDLKKADQIAQQLVNLSLSTWEDWCQFGTDGMGETLTRMLFPNTDSASKVMQRMMGRPVSDPRLVLMGIRCHIVSDYLSHHVLPWRLCSEGNYRLINKGWVFSTTPDGLRFNTTRTTQPANVLVLCDNELYQPAIQSALESVWQGRASEHYLTFVSDHRNLVSRLSKGNVHFLFVHGSILHVNGQSAIKVSTDSGNDLAISDLFEIVKNSPPTVFLFFAEEAHAFFRWRVS